MPANNLHGDEQPCTITIDPKKGAWRTREGKMSEMGIRDRERESQRKRIEDGEM